MPYIKLDDINTWFVTAKIYFNITCSTAWQQ